jgi:hypothetical protein
MARPAWLVLGALVAELGGGAAPRSAAEAFAALAEAVPAVAGLDYETLSVSGRVLGTQGAASPAGAFTDSGSAS